MGKTLHASMRTRTNPSDEVREENAKLRAVIDALPEAVFVFDSARRIVDCCAGEQIYLKRYCDGALDRRLDDLPLDPVVADLFRVAIAAALNGESSSFEYEFFAEDMLRDFEARMIPSGSGAVCFVRDVSDRKDAERRMRESEEMFRQIAENIEEVFWVRARRSFLYVSRAYETVWGRSREEAYQRRESFFDAIHPDDRERALETFFSERYAEQSHDEEFRVVRPDGETRWVLARSFPVMKEGSAIRVTGVARDVTESKRARRKLAESRDSLRGLLKRREHIREEERASVAREIHDDLGQRLIGLKMQTSWLAERLEDGEKRLAEKGRQIVKMVEDAMGTASTLAKRLRPSLIDNLGVGAAIEWLVESWSESEGLTISQTIEADEANVGTSRGVAVFRIAQEALNNVVKHSNAKNVEVSLVEEGTALRLVVRDDGAGFSDECLNKPDAYGLLGMRERADEWNGEVKFFNHKKGGAVVEATFPPL
jgi:two-component system, NarL family, sensor histidine kinase UhpB